MVKALPETYHRIKKILLHVLLLINYSFSYSAHTDHATVISPKMNEHKKMHGMYGRYGMSRECSGTSWVPESTPMPGFQIMHHEWMLMFQGYSYLMYDKQGGPLGGKKIFDENMFMFMLQRDLDKGTLALRTMFSLEPFTIGPCGYPLLLQTGETCNGVTPLINRQHPHDLFDELAVVYSHTFRENDSVFFYFGLPGEPALGPPTYVMRFSAYFNPEAPITHHWMDSTHITFGVATAGIIVRDVKLEFSVFTGREPDQYRLDLETPRFDSYSMRLSYNPTDDVALQVSYGFLKSPEQLEPCVNSHRFRLSGIYNKTWHTNTWQTMAALGINVNRPGHTLPAVLLESTLDLHTTHIIFGRFEAVTKDDLFIRPNIFADQPFNVQKLTGGYVYEFATGNHIACGIGGLLSGSFVPQSIAACYKNTLSYMFFLQIRLV